MKHLQFLSVLIMSLVILACGLGFPQQIQKNSQDLEITPINTAVGAISRVSPKDSMIQVLIPEGEFIMGEEGTGAIDNYPEHIVFLDEYWIDQTEVTNGQYYTCVKAGECTPPGSDPENDEFSHYAETKYQDHPVDFISWHQAFDYCQWAGRRLPTEAEWEKAARGTKGQKYPWGESPPNRVLVNYRGPAGQKNPLQGTNKVGSYPAGASPYGILDMAGNVEEWVADWHDQFFYKISPLNNPQGPASGTQKVYRGGYWSTSEAVIYSSYRSASDPNIRYYWNGFRCAE